MHHRAALHSCAINVLPAVTEKYFAVNLDISKSVAHLRSTDRSSGKKCRLAGQFGAIGASRMEVAFICGGKARRVVKEAVRKREIKVKMLRSNLKPPGCGPVAIRRRRGAARAHPFMLQIDAQFPGSTEVRYARKPCATNLDCVSSLWQFLGRRASGRGRRVQAIYRFVVETCRHDYVPNVTQRIHDAVIKTPPICSKVRLSARMPVAEVVECGKLFRVHRLC